MNKRHRARKNKKRWYKEKWGMGCRKKLRELTRSYESFNSHITTLVKVSRRGKTRHKTTLAMH
jgi:peroxiredoxin